MIHQKDHLLPQKMVVEIIVLKVEIHLRILLLMILIDQLHLKFLKDYKQEDYVIVKVVKI